MKIELVKEFTFRSLCRPHPQVSGQARQFRLSVAVESEIDLQSQTGELIGYRAIEDAVQPLIDQYLDQAYLNEIQELELLTPAAISHWIRNRLAGRLPGLSDVWVQEVAAS